MLQNNIKNSPLPIFDSEKFLNKNIAYKDTHKHIKNQSDYLIANSFLEAYRKKTGTFTSYRREIEKFINWAWNIKLSSINDINSDDLIEYINFLKFPPTSWIGNSKQRRFISANELRIPNIHWRPFVYPQNHIKEYKVKNSSISESIMILRTFYNFLLKNKYTHKNPSICLKYMLPINLNDEKDKKMVIKLTKNHKKLLLQFITKLANKNPGKFERQNFILHLIILMNLKSKDIVGIEQSIPMMNNFFKQNDTWYFKTLLNNNIQVNSDMLLSLKRWRMYLDFQSLPKSHEFIPLLPKEKGDGGISTLTHLRRLIQPIFNALTEELLLRNDHENSTFFQNIKLKHIFN
ncbi:hypothetical protein L3V83_05535 [Thiotrichales bacterium 19X7-9]|nr:hypothetical protein [Thiotrichales bacterium 19X7-9]